MGRLKGQFVVGVDIDNVIAQTDPELRKLIGLKTGISLRQEDVIYYEYSRCGISRQDEQQAMRDFEEWACSDLELVPWSVESLAQLRTRGYRIVLITSRNPVIKGKTEEWLKKRSVPYDALLFEEGRNKLAHGCHFFVEDNAEVAMSLAKSGTVVFLFDYPWNHDLDHPNVIRVWGWPQVLTRLP